MKRGRGGDPVGAPDSAVPAPLAHARIVTDARDLGVRITEPQARTLVTFHDLLRDRAVSVGLLSESDSERIYERHVLDCIRAATVFGPNDRLACDLGSGAGLPGVVLAVAVPHCRFVLLEPRRRAVAFLELAVDHLELSNAEVLPRRAEEARLSADVVTARAFAPIERSWPAATTLLRHGGRFVYFAGERLLRVRDLPPTTPPPVLAFRGSLIIMTKS